MENKLKQLMATQEDGVPSTLEKKQKLEKYKVDVNYDRLQKGLAETEQAKSVNLSVLPENFHEQLDNQHNSILQSVNDGLPFVTEKLTEFVPFFYPNLILIGATTGEGKTTTSSNIVHCLFKNQMKALVISNEELTLNVYNRVACLDLGLNFHNFHKFTEEENDKLKQKRRELSDYLTVADITYHGNSNFTSSVEGVEALLESIVKNGTHYDCILIDYYQNISKSKLNWRAQKHEILTEVKVVLDKYYKLIKAPIVVFTQLHPATKGNDQFETRIKEGRSIITAATFVLELVADTISKTTVWKCHKDRYRGNKGKQIETRWVSGRYKDNE